MVCSPFPVPYSLSPNPHTLFKSTTAYQNIILLPSGSISSNNQSFSLGYALSNNFFNHGKPHQNHTSPALFQKALYMATATILLNW
jgi:hypothetical protein